MDDDKIKKFIEKYYDNQIIPNFMEFLKIPNGSPSYDPFWDQTKSIEKAADFLANWVKSQNIKGLTSKIHKEIKRTPFLYIEIDPTSIKDKRTYLMYGHMDKQPGLDGWSEGLGPYNPQIINGKLYGRGASDDGYALFSAIASIKTCQENNFPLPKIVIIIEGAEESYTEDLEFYLNSLKDKIGTPELIICLDSCCEDYKRLWMTTSLRGCISIELNIKVLSIGMHSGGFSGLVPDSFMILRTLLERIENSKNGELKERSLYVDIPQNRKEEIKRLFDIIGEDFVKQFPFCDKTNPLYDNVEDLIIANTWMPSLAIVGADGFPEANISGNVLRPETSVKLSFRLPPMVDSKTAGEKICEILTKNVPFNAKVEAKIVDKGEGFNLQSKNFSENLKGILNNASKVYYGNAIEYMGEGGSVPFVEIFGEKFPQTDIAIIGVSGPWCNIHGTDENLDLDYCKKFTCCLTYLIKNY